jgi:hypothetical protein
VPKWPERAAAAALRQGGSCSERRRCVYAEEVALRALLSGRKTYLAYANSRPRAEMGARLEVTLK